MINIYAFILFAVLRTCECIHYTVKVVYEDPDPWPYLSAKCVLFTGSNSLTIL